MNLKPLVPVLIFVLVTAACIGADPTAEPGSTAETDGTVRAPLSTEVNLPTIGPTVVPTPTPTPVSSTELSPEPSPSGSRSFSRRTPFVPLDNPLVLSAQEATFLDDDELVLGVEWQGEAHAYPIRMLRFHHIVNDTIAGRPLLITY